MEGLLGQARAEEVRNFLLSVKPSDVCITDFAVYSIGLKLFRLNRRDDFRAFLTGTLGRGVAVRALDLQSPDGLFDAAGTHRLDFDDAYQYGVALQYNLIVVSFDADFDHTTRGRKTPREIVSQLGR